MNIALIDDHMMLAESLATSLRNSIPKSSIKIFAKARLFLSNNFEEWMPDLVISDVVMPEMDGLEMYKKSTSLLDNTCRFIFLSAVTDISLIKGAIRDGAKGFVSKDASITELLLAIEYVLQGKQYVSQGLKDLLLNQMLSNEPAPSNNLSPREKEVLKKLCDGRTVKEIAFDLNLSANTIQLYNTAILRKLKFNRTLDAVTYAINSGLYQKLKEE